MSDRKYSDPAKLFWYPDISCPVCGGEVNSWDKRCSRALGYHQIVCEACISKEYGLDVEELRDTMKNHFGDPVSGDMKEVNELTRRLLAERWLPEDTPLGTRPYLDYEGGWTYTSEAIRSIMWETPCGLLADGRHFLNGYLSYQGVDWRPENGNPVICCPVFPSAPCPLRDPLLRSEKLSSHSDDVVCQCACHQTDRPYTYEGNVDEAHGRNWKEAEERWDWRGATFWATVHMGRRRSAPILQGGGRSIRSRPKRTCRNLGSMTTNATRGAMLWSAFSVASRTSDGSTPEYDKRSDSSNPSRPTISCSISADNTRSHTP